MTLELKLRVPWRRDLLPVDHDNQDVIRVIKDSGSPNVCTLGNVVRVVDFFGVNNRVPDVSRYHIGGNRQPVRHCDIPESQLRPQLRTIVLLVESPHSDEYQCGNYFPIAPARGSTGRNIHRCLRTVLSRVGTKLRSAELNVNEHIVPGDHVIISNPVQFQTSLHAIHGHSPSASRWSTLRNNVWKALWNEGGEGGYIQLCFLARLNTYKPRLIVNACTGRRNDTNSLNSIVTGFVQDKFPNVPLFYAHHPSIKWSNCNSNNTGLKRNNPQREP